MDFIFSLLSCCYCALCQSEVPVHESGLRLRNDGPAESANVMSNSTEHRGPEAFYVNITSAGLKAQQLCDTGSSKARSCSADNVAKDGSYDDSLDLVITEPDDATQLSNSQKCTCHIVWSLFTSVLMSIVLFMWVEYSRSCSIQTYYPFHCAVNGVSTWMKMTVSVHSLVWKHIFWLWQLPSVLWHCWFGVRKSMQSVKIEWWGVGVVICLERGADWLHIMVQLHPKTPIISHVI